MYKLLTLFLAFFYYQHTAAQSNYLPGYIIKSDGETVRGFIDFQEWRVNPKKIRFKTNEAEKSTAMTIKTIEGFGIDEKESYVRRTVDVNIAPIKVNEINHSRKPIFKKRTIFLRILVEGKANLYFLYDEVGKEHFFIEKDDLPAEELIYTEYIKLLKNKRAIIPFEQYKGQLNEALTDCDGLFFAVKDAEYKRRDLVAIFEGYNTCNSASSSFSAKKEKVKIQIEPGVLIGLGANKLDFIGTMTHDLGDMDFDISPAYSFGAYLNILGDRSRGRYALRNELIYNSIGGSTHHEDIQSEDVYAISDVKLNLGYLQLNTLFRYTIPTEKIRPYINGGVGISVIITQVNEIVRERKLYALPTTETGKAINYIKKQDFSIVAGLGITSARFSSELRFEFGKRISPYIASSGDNKTLMIVVSYKLGK